MPNTILLVFEGSKTEPQIIKTIQEFFFANDGSAIISAVYGTVIYHLWKKVNGDPFIDLSEVLREMHDDNIPALDKLERDLTGIILFPQIFAKQTTLLMGIMCYLSQLQSRQRYLNGSWNVTSNRLTQLQCLVLFHFSLTNILTI